MCLPTSHALTVFGYIMPIIALFLWMFLNYFWLVIPPENQSAADLVACKAVGEPRPFTVPVALSIILTVGLQWGRRRRYEEETQQ